jgi:hypothetical protein
MAEELGKIEKLSVDAYQKGRKLYFIPVLYSVEDSPEVYKEKIDKYWEQVQKQLEELEAKLGAVHKIYHELIPNSGDEGRDAIKELSEKSHELIKTAMDNGAKLEALEDNDLLTEFMDWNRCLVVGLQNPKVFTHVYTSYNEVGKKRNEYMAGKIDESLQTDEIGIIFMRENHQVQFPSDIQVFYIAPPALDEIKRWLREQETKSTDDI